MTDLDCQNPPADRLNLDRETNEKKKKKRIRCLGQKMAKAIVRMKNLNVRRNGNKIYTKERR